MTFRHSALQIKLAPVAWLVLTPPSASKAA
jgi:hypothetical protein